MNYGILTFIENNRVTEPPTLWTRKKNDPPSHAFRFIPPYDQKPQSPADVEVAPSFRDDICLKVFTEKAVAYISRRAAEAKTGKPFFIYLALNSPHLPLCASSGFTGKSKAGAYGDFMLETDSRVGEILAALDQHGLADNTLVLQTSDNGAETAYQGRITEFGHRSNGELKGGKRDIYEGGHRVPFVVRWPAVIKAGRTCAEPVCQSDLLATCADLLGVKLPDDAGEDSFSLLPALRGDEYPQPLRGALMHHSGSGHFAIRDGRWKLNLFRGSGGSLAPKLVKPKPGEPPFELYDMQSDWRETTNVHDQHLDVVESLRTTATKIVRDGRSTPGAMQKNDGPARWAQLTWIPEAPGEAMPRAKGKTGRNSGDDNEAP